MRNCPFSSFEIVPLIRHCESGSDKFLMRKTDSSLADQWNMLKYLCLRENWNTNNRIKTHKRIDRQKSYISSQACLTKKLVVVLKACNVLKKTFHPPDCEPSDDRHSRNCCLQKITRIQPLSWQLRVNLARKSYNLTNIPHSLSQVFINRHIFFKLFQQDHDTNNENDRSVFKEMKRWLGNGSDLLLIDKWNWSIFEFNFEVSKLTRHNSIGWGRTISERRHSHNRHLWTTLARVRWVNLF